MAVLTKLAAQPRFDVIWLLDNFVDSDPFLRPRSDRMDTFPRTKQHCKPSVQPKALVPELLDGIYYAIPYNLPGQLVRIGQYGG